MTGTTSNSPSALAAQVPVNSAGERANVERRSSLVCSDFKIRSGKLYKAKRFGLLFVARPGCCIGYKGKKCKKGLSRVLIRDFYALNDTFLSNLGGLAQKNS